MIKYKKHVDTKEYLIKLRGLDIEWVKSMLLTINEGEVDKVVFFETKQLIKKFNKKTKAIEN